MQDLKRMAKFYHRRQSKGIKSSVNAIIDFFKTIPNELRL
jgi:hypothetical protein